MVQTTQFPTLDNQCVVQHIASGKLLKVKHISKRGVVYFKGSSRAMTDKSKRFFKF